MDEHTPTTESVRYAYVKFTRDAFVASTSELEQEFDRWLQQHDREVAANALDNAAENMNYPKSGAPYEVWASGAGGWLRDCAADLRIEKAANSDAG